MTTPRETSLLTASHRRRACGWLTRVWLVALLVGCAETPPSSAGETHSMLNGSVCPFCEPQSGGETSDFDGTPHPCEAVSEHVRVDDAESEILGFDIAKLKRQIQGEIDAILHFATDRSRPGALSAEGFSETTQIRGNVNITPGSLVIVQLDRQLCDGGVCKPKELKLEVEQASCTPRLHFNFQVELSTSDGTLQTSGTGDGVFWLGDEAPRGSARFDLTSVLGALKITSPSAPGPFTGIMVVDLRFDPNVPTSGHLYFYVSDEPNNVFGGPPVALDGYWPTLPPKPEPGTSGPVDE